MPEQNNAGTKILPDGSISILIPLAPHTKKNSQKILQKKVVTKGKGTKYVPFISPSDIYKQYSKDCSLFIRPLRIISPVNIRAFYYMPTRRNVDLTNLHEALHDILVEHGCLSDDNAKIVVSTDGSRVFYDKENPRTEVLITAAESTFPGGTP